ncbi:MAG: hypothetical protein HYS08_01545 [Chlamydiae bacterium]|nr:hypothetical protein [Chlamydiota bacterium]MBI3267263.1 hypothetical protein [Chlamydiota bacterium]
MISFRQIEELINMKTDSLPLVSFYLGMEGSRYSKKNCENALKDLMKEREKDIQNFEKNKNHKLSLEKDFEKIRQYVKNELDWKGKKGVAIFSSSSMNFWQVYFLPSSVKNTLVIDHTPYIRPLIALFDEYRRFCMVLVDKSKARIFEVFLGEIEEHTEFTDALPRKAKAGGWKGYEENRIQRHLTEEVRKHFKKVADSLTDLFKLHHFDWLILGGHRAEFPEFEKELRPFLEDRIVARLEMDLRASQENILEKALKVEKEISKEHGETSVKNLLELTGERQAVTGVLGTLTAFRRGQVHSLVVSRDYQVPGMRCLKCGYLDQEHKNCPQCKEPLQAIPDLVDDLVEAAVTQGCKVEYVSGNGRDRQWGGIGAILRFKG